jgi:hypothetical protein
MEFDDDIAVRPEDGGYAADLRPGWVVGGGLNGGYLLAVLGNAGRAVLPSKPDPVAVSAHYLSASVPGPALVRAHVERDGGSMATASLALSQGGTARITALATYADLATLDGPVETTATEPNLPPRERCLSPRDAPDGGFPVPALMHRFDLLFDPAHLGWAQGRPGGEAVMQAWLRLADGREPDPLSLLLAVDALPPVTFELGRMGWAPTIELTAHVRARPAPGWLRVRHASRNVAGGLFEEDCEVWDSAGRLVAQSRQLARLPRLS